MAPRNSQTKVYRKYRKVGTKTPPIPMEKIYGLILNPEQAVNNKYEQEFNRYREEKLQSNQSPSEAFDYIEKDEQDSDKRYSSKSWYQDKIRYGI